MRVLLVEDHAKLALTLANGLRREGMAVDVVFDGHDALTQPPPRPTTSWSSIATSPASTAMRSAAAWWPGAARAAS